MALRSGGAQTRHPQIDDVRFYFAEIGICQSDPLNYVNTVIIEHSVGLGNQIVQHLGPFGMLEIYGEGSLVAVEFKKTRRNVGIFSGAEKPKRVHTALTRFDFDNVRSQLRQDRRSIRSGEHVIKTYDAHAILRTVATSRILVGPLSSLPRDGGDVREGIPAVENRHATNRRPRTVDDERHP